MSYTLNSHNTFIELGADLVRFKAEVHFDGMEIAKLNMKTMDLPKTLEVSFYSCACNIVIVNTECHTLGPTVLFTCCSIMLPVCAWLEPYYNT